MQSYAVDSGETISNVQVWTGRIISGLAALFFIMDGVMKLFKPAVVVKATQELGYPESQIVGIGLTLLVCTVLYIAPATSAVGAILLTGYLGGAIVSQIRVQAKWSSVIFAAVFGCLVWAGLWLRDLRLRHLLR